jgi:hypothetical protein
MQSKDDSQHTDRFLYEELPESISVQSISQRGICRHLEEVVGSATRHHWLASARARIELEAKRVVSKVQIVCVNGRYAQGVFQMFVNLHDCGLIAAAVTVIGSREYRDDVSVLTPVVTFHDQLMGASDQRQTVVVVEGLADVLTESVASTSGAYSPTTSVVGITPEQIAHGTLVGHLLDSVERTDVVERVDAR